MDKKDILYSAIDAHNPRKKEKGTEHASVSTIRDAQTTPPYCRPVAASKAAPNSFRRALRVLLVLITGSVLLLAGCEDGASDSSPKIVAPSAVSDFVATVNSLTSIRLTWTNPDPTADNLKEIRISWATVAAPDTEVGNHLVSTPTEGAAGSHIVTDLTINIAYRFSLVAVYNDGTTLPTTPAEKTLSIDSDGDTLIDIGTLDMLSNIRNNLAGTFYSETAGASSGLQCGTNGATACTGYELMRNLDFADGTSYASDSINNAWRPNAADDSSGAVVEPANGINRGWEPIGSNDTTEFTTIFEGNGYTVKNLYSHNIANTGGGRTGLFGQIGALGVMRNLIIENGTVIGGTANDHIGIAIGLTRGSATITNAIVRGGSANGGAGNFNTVGGLVGQNGSTISASSSSAAVNVTSGDSNVVGGLVGTSSGTIAASYATGDVDGGIGNSDRVGGLVGQNTQTITASYATGNANAGVGNSESAGGLVGTNESAGTITASYATGNADGGEGTADRAGAIAGYNDSGTITASYGFGVTDGEVLADPSAAASPSNGTDRPSGVTLPSQLTAPGTTTPANTATPTQWNQATSNTLNAWDFGTGTQAPALKYADYDADAAGTDYCASFPAKILGTETNLSCNTTLLLGQSALRTRSFSFDLAVPSITANPSSTIVGVSVTLSATVRNASNAITASTSTLTYYRSTDATIDTSDTPLSETDAIPALNANATSDESIMITAPSTAGTYYYGACVSTAENEANTTNNCSTAVQLTLIPPPPADVPFSGTFVARISNDDTELDGAYDTVSATIGGKQYLYVAGFEDDGVSSFEIMNDGSLVNRDNISDNGTLKLDGAISITTATIGGKQYLYVAGNTDDGVSSFEMMNDGSLVNRANISDNATLELDGAFGIATATVGSKQYLFVAGNTDDGVSSLEIGANGTITAGTGNRNIADTGTLKIDNAVGLATATIGGKQYLYVAGFEDDGVSSFEIMNDGSLVNRDNISDNGTLELDGAFGLTTATIGSKQYLFVASDNDDGVSSLEIGANGTLTAGTGNRNIADNDTLELDGARGLTTTTIGSGDTAKQYLFVSGSVDDGVSSLEIGANGILTAGTGNRNISNSGTLELDGVIGLTTATVGSGDTAKQYLFVAGVVDDGVSSLSIGTDGGLTGGTGARNIADGDGPIRLSDPAGITSTVIGATRYLFVAASNEDGVSSFSVDNESGRLTYLNSVINASTNELDGAWALATATIGSGIATKHYLFVAGVNDNGISSLEISTTGQLTHSTASGRNINDDGTLEIGGILGLAVGTVGEKQFLIATGSSDDGVSVFEIGSSGTLAGTSNTADTTDLKLDGATGVATTTVGSKTFVFVGGQNDDGVSVFELTSTGTLTPVQNVSDNTELALDGAYGVTTAVVGERSLLFVAGQVDNGVSVFAIGNDGMLTHLSTMTDGGDLELDGAQFVTTVTVNGATDLFVGGNADNGISVFRVSNAGILTSRYNIAASDTARINGVRGLNAAVVGRKTLLFAASSTDNNISVFR